MNNPVRLAVDNVIHDSVLELQFCECIEADEETSASTWPMFNWLQTEDGRTVVLRCTCCGSKYAFQVVTEDES